jgi:hypothetical protein
VPLTRARSACWILLVHAECTGELRDYHWPADDPASLADIERIRWHLFAHNPMAGPPNWPVRLPGGGARRVCPPIRHPDKLSPHC